MKKYIFSILFSVFFSYISDIWCEEKWAHVSFEWEISKLQALAGFSWVIAALHQLTRSENIEIRLSIEIRSKNKYYNQHRKQKTKKQTAYRIIVSKTIKKYWISCIDWTNFWMNLQNFAQTFLITIKLTCVRFHLVANIDNRHHKLAENSINALNSMITYFNLHTHIELILWVERALAVFLYFLHHFVHMLIKILFISAFRREYL